MFLFSGGARSRVGVAILVILVLMIGSAAALMALNLTDPTTTWNVTAVQKNFPQDRQCPAGSTLVKDRFVNITVPSGGGTADETYIVNGNPVNVTITWYADNSFDFEVEGGVMPQMFVKGGQGGTFLLYQYQPPVSGATNTGPVSYDTGLHDGVNPNNSNEYQDISHLDFCLIAKAEPTIVTTPIPDRAEVGATLQDSAELSGGDAPTGMITFNLYPPGDSQCTGSPVHTEEVSVSGNGSYSTSEGFVATQVGTYNWTADYSGDANNSPATSSCGLEEVLIEAPIKVFKYHDNNLQNGVFDGVGSEDLLDGWTFTLYETGNPTPLATGETAGTATTAHYSFGPYPPGDYTVCETTQAGWNNTDPDASSVIDPENLGRPCKSITISEGDTVTSVDFYFGNYELDPSIITIIKDADPDSDTEFHFTASAPLSPSSFILVDDGDPNDDPPSNRQIFEPVYPGQYTFTETGVAGYTTSIQCTGGSPQVQGLSVTITVSEGDEINCTFTNTEDLQKVTPEIATVPQPASGLTGDMLNDNATLSGGDNPTGTIEFKLYPPGDATCAGDPAFSQLVTVDQGNSTYSTSGGHMAAQVGTYRWTAEYSGDENNNPAFSGCQEELVVIEQRLVEVIVRKYNDNNPQNGAFDGVGVEDLLAGWEFTLYETGNPTVQATGTTAGSTTDAHYSFGQGVPGNYTICETTKIDWVNSDPGGAAALDPEDLGRPCKAFTLAEDTQDVEVVFDFGNYEKAQTSIVTTPLPASGQIGTVLFDNATLSGGVEPTGKITFNLYPPGDNFCEGEPVYTEDVDVTGNGLYTTQVGVVATQIGTYNWTAAYSGDDFNKPAFGNCGLEQVVIGSEPPSIKVNKDAEPSEVFEPGEDVEFIIDVLNNGGQDLVITDIDDSFFGNLNNECGLPQPLAVGETYTCRITRFIGGQGGDIHYNRVTVTAITESEEQVIDTSDEDVHILDLPSSISVSENASKSEVLESGEVLIYTVATTNSSQVDMVTIENVTDTKYGDLSGECLPGGAQVLAVGEVFTCEFSRFVNGASGDVIVNTTTVSGVDDDGTAVSASVTEQVVVDNVASSISVGLAANVDYVYEPGGDVTFAIAINNSSAADMVTINKITDNVYGDITADCLTQGPVTLSPGQELSCDYTRYFGGQMGETQSNHVSVFGMDDDGYGVSDFASEGLIVRDTPSVMKVTQVIEPQEIAVPGGLVDVTVEIKNESVSDEVQVTDLIDPDFSDTIYSCTPSLPATLQPGESISCQTRTFVNGQAGDEFTSSAAASGIDDDGYPVSDMDEAVIRIVQTTSVRYEIFMPFVRAGQ